MPYCQVYVDLWLKHPGQLRYYLMLQPSAKTMLSSLFDIVKVAVKQFAHAINCFINTAETKPYIMLKNRYSVNNSGSQ